MTTYPPASTRAAMPKMVAKPMDLEKIIAVHPYMHRAKLCGNLPAAGSHGFLAKLPVIFEMHIGTVSCRVKSGPLRQSRFGNGNGT